VEELRETVLVARGSVPDTLHRTKLATAVTRAAVAVERTMAAPRFIGRREGERVLIATTQERDVCFINAPPVSWERRHLACVRSGPEARTPRHEWTGAGLTKWTSSWRPRHHFNTA
jgi:hypothetical protein